MKALVIGTGAVGSFYGALLAKQGADVSVVARTDYEVVRFRGIEVESPLGHLHFMPHRVVRDAAELPDKPDYVLVCVKIVEQADRVALLRGALGPDTSIVLIANGIDIEHEIFRAYPDHELISGLAFICVTRTAPGKIWHQAYGRLVLGDYPYGLSERVHRLRTAFQKSGIPCIPSEDIISARWQKCVWNAAFNPTSVLSGGLGTADILSTQEPLVRALMREIQSIGTAAGYAMPDDIVDRNVESTRRMPPYKTSMLLDFEAGRPMETEAILGNAVRAARKAGVSAPHLETVYALLKLRELQITSASSQAQR
jgi:2-dehydropantoate 2-reductase